jgi:hypothetical protein
MEEPTTPVQPHWYRSPQPVEVKVEKAAVDPFGEEVAVVVRLNGSTKSAIVPASAYDLERRIVHGVAIGEVGGSVLVSLPPSTMGKTTLRISKANIAGMVPAK